MNNTSSKTQPNKVCKMSPHNTGVKKKAILNFTLQNRFFMRSSLQNFTRNTVDLPLISHNRISSLGFTNSKLTNESSGYNAIAQVQAIPLTSQTAAKQFSSYLSKYETGEILEYAEVHFLGMKAQKIQPNSSDTNYGFDDERSDYKIVIGDHLAYRYEVQHIIGKGSFGQVCLCFDHKNKEQVAIKVIRNQARFHKQGRIEVKVLSTLKAQNTENYAVTMLDSFIFRKHLCISFELLGANLYEMLKANSFRGFSQSYIKKIAFQLLSCLKNLKENKIIHCDLKPENILSKRGQKANVKVIDFGSSCFYNEKIHAYIQSRFYRAPEILLGINYSEAIDMWSFGCIISELHLGYPIFPGESEIEQMLCIIEVRGLPPDYLLERALKRRCYFEGNALKSFSNSRGKRRMPGTKPLELLLKNTDSKFLDFLDCCLKWDPERRMDPEAGLLHPWLTE
ncbi:hypothetical protein SteCoe_18432 [Stentor coeruleus]|uniref:dual-specificity kinase n=1 Tax=Stentor coeruleus TaxID=5963 RepID=A0A1R2BWL9_9CILI|nr:hypothetical protein SteCoe_18432 [Stentor coeruleus]